MVETTSLIGEVVATIREVVVTIKVIEEVVIVDNMVVEEEIKGNNIIILGNRVHLHQVYLLLMVLVLL